jgi:hypothetical protein
MPSTEAKARFFDGSFPSAVICLPTSQLATFRVPPYKPGASPATRCATWPAAGTGSDDAGGVSSRAVDSVNGSAPVLPADCRKTSPC